MTFATPAAFGLFVVVAALAAAFVALARWRARARREFGGPAARSWGGRSFGLRLLLILAGATLVVVAVARPQWGYREVEQERRGVDLVVALDISQSMQALDASPSRLALAQAELARLVESLIGSRVGLVIFAGDAVLRSPLTTDVHAIAELIRRADREVGLTRAGSDISRALTQAERILRASESPGRAVIVVSDGEDHVRAGASRAAELAEDGIVVLAAGVGTPGGTFIFEETPDGLERKLDADGMPVVSRLDAAELAAVAEAGGGRYLALSAAGDLDAVKAVLDSLDQTPLGEETQFVPIERFQIFAAVALALLVAAWIVPDDLRRPRLGRGALRLARRPALVLVALFLAAGCAEADAVRDRTDAANALYDAGEFEEALVAYQSLLTERPDLPELAYDTGNALHRLGEYERAVQETRRALPHDRVELGAATYYALGNHFFALGQLDDAYRAYRSALLLAPDDLDAKHNLELTLLRLEQTADQPAAPGNQPSEAPADEPSSPEAPTPEEGSPSAAPDASIPPVEGTPEATPEEVASELQEALAGLGDDVSVEDAIRILNLLQELRQTQNLAGGGRGSTNGPDY